MCAERGVGKRYNPVGILTYLPTIVSKYFSGVVSSRKGYHLSLAKISELHERVISET